MALATTADVETRLGRPLSPEETAKAEGLLAEASDLVIGHLRADPTDSEGVVPPHVVRVVSRMAARVLEQDASTGGVFGATTMTDQIGDFTQSRSFPQGTTSGGPWLSKADKVALRGPDGDSGAYAVDTVANAGQHSPYCTLAFGGLYCSCGAALTGSTPLWE